MDFKTIRIPYAGREKYPSREGGGNAVSNKRISNYLNNAGSMSSSVPISSGDHDRGGATTEENRGSNAKSFNVYMSKVSGIFNYAALEQLENTDQTVVRAFKDMSNAQVWIGNAIESSADTANYDIIGLPEAGMSVSVEDNGSTAATIVITVDHTISQDTGELHIPVCININDNNIDPYKAMWNIYTEMIILQELTYSWTINRSEGTPGATIRGPYDYGNYSATTRWWCDGTVNSAYSESEKWIDVIVKDGTYYYCNSTYYGTLAPWAAVSSAWTEGESFDFVATNLLLASGAAINFLTNNELYLRDSNNVVTAGARGGDNVNFWAGSSAPSGAPFMVMNDGTLYANKGFFAGYIQYPYVSVSALSIVNGYYQADNEHPYLVSMPWGHSSSVEQTVSATNVTTTQYLQGPATANRKYYLDWEYDGSGYSSRTGIKMKLPYPTAALNGYTFRILVAPSGGITGNCAVILRPTANDDRNIMNLIGAHDARSTYTNDYGYVMIAGCFTITCAPAYNPGGGTRWMWFITDGNPEFIYRIGSSQPW